MRHIWAKTTTLTATVPPITTAALPLLELTLDAKPPKAGLNGSPPSRLRSNSGSATDDSWATSSTHDSGTVRSGTVRSDTVSSDTVSSAEGPGLDSAGTTSAGAGTVTGTGSGTLCSEKWHSEHHSASGRTAAEHCGQRVTYQLSAGLTDPLIPQFVPRQVTFTRA